MLQCSIIIPTKDRHEIFQRTLEAAVNAGKENCEVIVINEGQDDLDIGQFDHVRVYNTGGKGVSYARNLGAKLAKYDLLIFIDNDILLNAENVRRILEVHFSFPKALVNPIWRHSDHIQNLKKTSLLGRFMLKYFHDDSFKSRYLSNNKCNWKENEVFQSQNDGFAECCFFISRKEFLKAGGFNEDFKFGKEGLEFSERLNTSGVKIFIDPQNVVIHNEIDRYVDYKLFVNRKKDDVDFYLHTEGGSEKVAPRITVFVYSILFRIRFIFEFLISRIPNYKILDPIYSKNLLILSQITFYSFLKERRKNQKTCPESDCKLQCIALFILNLVTD